MSFTRTEKIGAVIMVALLVAFIIVQGPAALGALGFAVAFITVSRVSRGNGPR
jgi:hypothetical protein